MRTQPPRTLEEAVRQIEQILGEEAERIAAEEAERQASERNDERKAA